ncbi:MAG: hypothetical protein HQK53_15630, partial [Oligoflexia bacterium]|nr:hypothetical protein [Oligoflexia bacterium]
SSFSTNSSISGSCLCCRHSGCKITSLIKDASTGLIFFKILFDDAGIIVGITAAIVGTGRVSVGVISEFLPERIVGFAAVSVVTGATTDA